MTKCDQIYNEKTGDLHSSSSSARLISSTSPSALALPMN
jgi:hypothetical protein